MTRSSLPGAPDSFRLYVAEITKHRLLTVDEEQRLARAYATGDTQAGHELITANLRFVVKVANEYRSYGFSVSDLVQEGNIGLLKALQKFDATKGIRFVSYAVWWIRAYIQNYILRSFSLVKLGTTQAQRKLFFSLARTKRELDRMSVEHGADSDGEDVQKIAQKLGVKASEVEEMSRRMGGRDFSLDAPVGDEADVTHVDFVADAGPLQDEDLSAAQQHGVRQEAVGAALAVLDARERFIVEQRLMSDRPMTLLELGEHFSFSRERARQIELRAKAKLEKKLKELAVELDWATDGTPVEIDERASA
jgi:RNA polymerase sigma-32 factor